MTATDLWVEVLDGLLRPARPDLDRCVREGDVHKHTRQLVSAERAAALASCAARIEVARAAVFAANDGRVPRRMTELEREWLALSRQDPDGDLMDLWARIAPPSWHDRKRWRDSRPAAQLDVTIALASDVLGVLAAESAVGALRLALAPWGAPIGAPVRWRAIESDHDGVGGLLREPLVAAQDALARHPREAEIRLRSERARRAVHDAACARLPARTLLAEGVAHAAFVDSLLRAVTLPARPDPVAPLRDLWRTGYVIGEADARGVTLEVPPL